MEIPRSKHPLHPPPLLELFIFILLFKTHAQKPTESAESFLHRLKMGSDELSAAGRPLSVPEFNIYVYKGI